MSGASLLTLASVGAVASDGAGALLAVPIALSKEGAVLVVKTVQSTARGSVYLLERVADGAQTSVEVVSKGVAKATLAVGTEVKVSVIGAGVVLSAVGEALPLFPMR